MVPNLSKSEKKSFVLALVPYYTDYMEAAVMEVIYNIPSSKYMVLKKGNEINFSGTTYSLACMNNEPHFVVRSILGK